MRDPHHQPGILKLFLTGEYFYSMPKGVFPRSGAEDYRKSLKIPDVLQARTVVISDIPEFLAGDNDHLLTFLTVYLPAVQIKDPVHARLQCLPSL
jgi:hypothetical protein